MKKLIVTLLLLASVGSTYASTQTKTNTDTSTSLSQLYVQLINSLTTVNTSLDDQTKKKNQETAELRTEDTDSKSL